MPCSSTPCNQEAATNEVQVDGSFSPDAVRAMLLFLYTDAIPAQDLRDLASQLLPLAHCYQMRDLVVYVERTAEISMENIKELLQVIPPLGCEEMMERVRQFTVQHARAILQQPGFLDGLQLDTCALIMKMLAGVSDLDQSDDGAAGMIVAQANHAR